MSQDYCRSCYRVHTSSADERAAHAGLDASGNPQDEAAARGERDDY